MKFLFIHCTSDLYGASRMMLRTISKLISDSNEVLVILPSYGLLVDELKKCGADVIIINADPTIRKTYLKSPIKFLSLIQSVVNSFFKIRKISIQKSINVIITNTSQTLVGGFVARSLGLKHICHVRESYENYGIFWNFFEKFLLANTDLLICVSKAMMYQFNKKTHFKKVCYVHDGFPLDEFNPVEDFRIKSFKQKYDLENNLIVGVVGRIILRRKGQEVFVNAIKEIIHDIKDVKFIIVGGCYPGNEHHLEKLNTLIDKLNLKENIIITGEINDIKTVYASLDISIMSSAEPEPFGGVTLESMAFSKPVIGTNIGGTPEQIIDDVTGILVEPNNSFEMGKAILKLINDPDLRKKMGYMGRKRFEEEFGFEPYYNKITSHYKILTK